MKAVVVELNKGKAAVLSDDGCVVTIKNNNYEIGQVIQMSNPKVRFNKKIATFAASAAACVLIGIGGYAYASPYTYVSLDVNPSIEFSVNRFNRVLNVKAVNDDGEEILKEISLDDLENKTIYDALTATVSQISEAGYFDGDIEGGMVITTSSEDMEKAEDLAEELQETVEQETSELGDEVEVEVISVALERVDEAKELGVTPGKLNLVEKLQAAAGDTSDINLEEWLNKPVKEIMKATKDYRKAAAEVTDETEAEEAAESNELQDIDAAGQQEEDTALENAEDTKKDAEKAKAAEEKAAEKAKKAEEKASEKAKAAEEKASEKAKKVEEKEVETVKPQDSKKTDDTQDKTIEKSEKKNEVNSGKKTQVTNDKAVIADSEEDKAENSELTDTDESKNSNNNSNSNDKNNTNKSSNSTVNSQDKTESNNSSAGNGKGNGKN